MARVIQSMGQMKGKQIPNKDRKKAQKGYNDAKYYRNGAKMSKMSMPGMGGKSKMMGP